MLQKLLRSQLSACTRRLVSIFHGCPLKKTNKKPANMPLEKVSRFWLTLITRSSLLLLCVSLSSNTDIHLLLFSTGKKNKKTTHSTCTVNCECCLSSLPLSLTDSWHISCFYFADWHWIYWQGDPHCKQAGGCVKGWRRRDLDLTRDPGWKPHKAILIKGHGSPQQVSNKEDACNGSLVTDRQSGCQQRMTEDGVRHTVHSSHMGAVLHHPLHFSPPLSSSPSLSTCWCVFHLPLQGYAAGTLHSRSSHFIFLCCYW